MIDVVFWAGAVPTQDYSNLSAMLHRLVGMAQDDEP